jgi:hypothetical protein
MDQRSNENSARAARVRRLQIPREFGEPPKIRSFCCNATCRRQQRAFCHPADRLDISQGTRGGFRIDSLLARRREKKPVRPIADGESSFALSLRVVALRNSRRTVIRFVIASLLLAGFIALSSVEASAVVCARGVYRAGCVAPGGAVVVRRPVVAPGAVVAPRAAVVRRRVY